MARLSHSDQQSSATMSGIFAIGCPPERRGPRNAERWQDLRPMHDSRDLDAKGGLPWQRLREKHAFRANAARETPFCVQSAKRGYMARESCHSSQSNLEDRHNESIGRQNANPKKDPGTTAKSPNTKATLIRPLFLAARSNAQINLSPRRFPQGHQSSQHETISKTAQHQGSLEKSCLRKLIRRSSMST